MNRYRIFGLTIDSAIDLPELPPASPDSPEDVVVRLGLVPALEPGRFASVEPDEVVLQCEQAGRYRVSRGSSIVVEPGPGATEAALRLYLLGSALGAVIHQRGLLPLHSNAVVIGGKAVAFAGPPGEGKSTLAAWFHDQGDQVLSDDVCAIEARDGVFFVHPGVPRLRLRRDALEATGRSVGEHAEAFDGWAKYVVPTEPRSSIEPAQLSHIYLLSSAESGGLEIDRLSGSSAVQALSENTYRGFYVLGSGASERHFHQCTELARTVPVYAVRRPRGMERLASDSRVLREHARSVLAG